MRLFLLICLVLIAYALKRRRDRGQPALPPLPFAPRRPRFGTLTVAEVAFEYERAILELDDVSALNKNRAVWALSQFVVSLVGHVRLDEVTRDLETGIRAVLIAQLEDEGDWVGCVWDDLLRWGRYHFTPPAHRSVWAAGDD